MTAFMLPRESFIPIGSPHDRPLASRTSPFLQRLPLHRPRFQAGTAGSAADGGGQELHELGSDAPERQCPVDDRAVAVGRGADGGTGGDAGVRRGDAPHPAAATFFPF